MAVNQKLNARLVRLSLLSIVLTAAVALSVACGGSSPATLAPAATQPATSPTSPTTSPPTAVVEPATPTTAPTRVPAIVAPVATATKQSPTQVPTTAPAPTEPALAPGAAAAKLSAQGTEWTPGDEFEVQVNVIPGENGITAGEVHVAYDSSVLQATLILPGNLLGDNPLVALEEIDNDTGEAILALARLGPAEVPTPNGTIAEIRFVVNPNAGPGTYQLELISLALADQEFEDVTDVTLKGLSIDISGS